MLKLIGKKIFAIFENFRLSKPVLKYKWTVGIFVKCNDTCLKYHTMQDHTCKCPMLLTICHNTTVLLVSFTYVSRRKTCSARYRQ